jgi:hypothetical protein
MPRGIISTSQSILIYRPGVIAVGLAAVLALVAANASLVAPAN